MKDISLHLMDIVQNSIVAGARTIGILIEANIEADELIVGVKDDGKGMSAELLARVTSPFTTSRTTRKVGLGIPLFAAGAERSGGHLDIQSQPGVGTTITAVYGLSNIDRPPMGDLKGTVKLLVTINPDLDFVLTCRCHDLEFEMDTVQIRQVLQGVPLNSSDVAQWLDEYLEEGIAEVFGGLSI